MPTPTYDLIASNVLSSSASSVTFSSVPATYRDLILVTEGTATTNSEIYLRFNSDSGNNYNRVGVYADGSTSGSFTSTNQPQLVTGLFNTTRNLVINQIFDYSATDKHKSVLTRANTPANETAMLAGRWASTSAINTVLVVSSTSFASGTTFYLYGIVG